MVKFKDANLGYTVAIIEGLTVEFKAHQVHVITGRNGEGKSTLLNTIASLLPLLNGQMDRGCALQEIGFLNHYQPAMPGILVEEYLSYGLEKKQLDLSMLDRLNIHSLKGKFLEELSDGQFKKLALCRQLIKQPKMLLLDEPTNFLDQYNKKELGELLMSLSSSMTIFISTHDESFAQHCGTKFWEVSQKQVQSG